MYRETGIKAGRVTDSYQFLYLVCRYSTSTRCTTSSELSPIVFDTLSRVFSSRRTTFEEEEYPINHTNRRSASASGHGSWAWHGSAGRRRPPAHTRQYRCSTYGRYWHGTRYRVHGVGLVVPACSMFGLQYERSTGTVPEVPVLFRYRVPTQ